jgi:diguanylate cyclase (GGDEF)-like protein
MKSMIKQNLMEYTPKEKVYPLNYVCKYVIRRKQEVMDKEASSMIGLRQMEENLACSRDSITAIAKYLSHLSGTCSAGDIQADLAPLMDSLSANTTRYQADLDELLLRMTEKGLMFEDISNMLVQTEPLIVRMMYQDHLTCAYNRYFYITYEQELFESAQEGEGMSIAFFDIDDFKHFNTDYGHDFGDEVLQQFAVYVAENLRKTDNLSLVRMGGDEFVVVGSGIAYQDFIALIKRLVQGVAGLRITYGDTTAGISISAGTANAVADAVKNASHLYNLADERLYIAKDSGKSQVIWQ